METETCNCKDIPLLHEEDGHALDCPAGGPYCDDCSHPEYLHHEDELNMGVFCSAYAEASVADCDCKGFKETTP